MRMAELGEPVSASTPATPMRGAGPAADAAVDFPSRSQLPVLSRWWGPVLLAIAGAVMVIPSLGAMAGELGAVSLLVWIVTAIVGGLQCIVVTGLARRYSYRAGGGEWMPCL